MSKPANSNHNVEGEPDYEPDYLEVDGDGNVEFNRPPLTVTIGFTDSILNKTDRFMGKQGIRYELCRLLDEYPPGQQCWSKGRFTDEFHLRLPSEDYVLIFLDQLDHVVAMTQTHTHENYYGGAEFTLLSDYAVAKRFGHRLPAKEDRKPGREEALAVPDDYVRTVGATRGISD